MKAPDLKKLDGLKPDDDFTKVVQIESGKANTVVRKTFSLQQRDFDYINSEALKISQETGKVVNASQALRYILERDRSTTV